MLARPYGQPAGPHGGAGSPQRRVDLAEDHEAFISTYVSSDGHHWAITLEVSPLTEEDEDDDEEGEVASVISSLPTSPMADRRGGETQQMYHYSFPPS